MLIEVLKNKLNESRKARAATEVSILSTVIGNIMSNAKLVNGEKVVSDEDVLTYMKSHIKGLRETLTIREEPSVRNELNYLEANFMPKQLSEEELRKIWESVGTNVGDFMKHLKTNYFGQYDGKVASQIAKK